MKLLHAAPAPLPTETVALLPAEVGIFVSVLNEALALYREIMTIEQQLATEASAALTGKQLQDMSEMVQRAEQNLPRRLMEMRARFGSVDWNSAAFSLPDAYKNFLLASPSTDTPLHRFPALELAQMVCAKGRFSAEMSHSLGEAKRFTTLLLQEYQAHARALQSASEAAEKGDFLVADETIKKLNPRFSDLNYAGVREAVERCRSWIDTVNSILCQLGDEVIGWRGKRFFANPFAVAAARKETLEKLRAFRQEILLFKESLPETPSSEFDSEASELVETAIAQLWVMRKDLIAFSSVALLSACLQAFIVACLVVGFIAGLYFIFSSSFSAGLPQAFSGQETASSAAETKQADTIRLETGSLDIFDSEGGAMYKVFDGEKLLAEGRAPRLVSGLPAKEITVEFFASEPVPAESVRQTVVIPAHATATIVSPLPFTQVSGWIGKPFQNSIGMEMVWNVVANGWISKKPVLSKEFIQIQPHERATQLQFDHAVRWVSISDAQMFCDSLTARERTAGRLPFQFAYAVPTEREWALFTLSEMEKAAVSMPQDGGGWNEVLLERKVLGYDEDMDGEWASTLHTPNGSDLLLLGVKGAEGARMPPSQKDLVGFRCVLVRTDGPRGSERLKCDPGFSLHCQNGKNEVVWVDDRSPADRAGLFTGDQILEMGGKKILGEHYFNVYCRTLVRGMKIPIKILRNQTEWLELELNLN